MKKHKIPIKAHSLFSPDIILESSGRFENRFRRLTPLLTVLFVWLFLMFSGCAQQESNRTESEPHPTAQKTWAIALHGGAGTISPDMPEDRKLLYYEGLEQALQSGETVLAEGGSALDAVEAAVRSLENNPLFNAGRGSVFTSKGVHELDAAIMDGSTMQAGALTGLTTVKNPVSLARYVLEHSSHVFFSGAGAEEYANQTNIERVPNDYFSTDTRYEQLQRALDQRSGLYQRTDEDDFDWETNLKYGTVGAVALDSQGNLAAATSTGGMTNKQFGRVGDVPVIGSGTFANHVVAISATGWGEKIMQQVSANTIANLLEFRDNSLEEAMHFVLTERLDPGDAGFIGVDQYGNISMQMNTRGMYRASADSDGNRAVLIWEDE